MCDGPDKECEGGCSPEEHVFELTADDAVKISGEDVIELLETAAHTLGRIQRLMVSQQAAVHQVQTEAIRATLDRIQVLFGFIDDISK